MAFKKGQPKIAGRKKGSPNKRTLALQELWDTFNYDPARALQELLPKLEYEAQANVHLKLMPYKYVQKRAIELSGPNGEPIKSGLDNESKILLDELVTVIETMSNERRKA